MFPILEIGPLAIQSVGFFLLMSITVGFLLSSKFSEKLGTYNENIENGLLIIFGVFLISARLGYILQNPATFIENPGQIISLSTTTLNISFGILVSVITTVTLAQRNHLPLLPTLDTFTPLLILLFIGLHLANLANGDAFGLPTQLPWGVELWGAKRHPVQIYALVLLACYFLWMIYITKGLKQTGFMQSGMLFTISTGVIAMITIFTRAFVSERILLGMVDILQLIGLIVIIVCYYFIYHKLFRLNKHIEVILSLGSNDNPQSNLIKGSERLQEIYKVTQASSVYRTQAVNTHSESQEYFNQIFEIITDLPFSTLRNQLKAIEQEFGREPGNKDVVPLDIDIITYSDQVFSYQGNQIPDPDLAKYRYIAQPLAEMAPNFRHPATGISIKKLIAQTKDNSQITKIEEVDNEFTG